MRARAGSTPHIAWPSSSAHRYSSPPHSASTGRPRCGERRAPAARSGALASSSAPKTSGKPPASTSAPAPSGSASSRSGSNGSELGAGRGAAARGSPRSETRTPGRGRSRSRAGARLVGRPGLPGRAVGARGRAGEALDGVEVDVARRGAARARRARRALRGSRSAAGTRPRWRSGATTRSSRRSAPSDRDAERRDRLAQQLLVVVGADPVEDHAGDVDLGVERAVAVDDRGGRARHRAGVDDEERPARCSSLATCAVEASSPRPDAPSNSPMTPSIDRDVGAGASRGARSGAISSGPLRNASRLRPGPARGERVVARVDVVGADLEALHDEPAARAARR